MLKLGFQRIKEDRLDSGPRMTWCANCFRKQPDPMRERATCIHCGCSPLPSRAYGLQAGALYPREKSRSFMDLAEEVLRQRNDRKPSAKGQLP